MKSKLFRLFLTTILLINLFSCPILVSQPFVPHTPYPIIFVHGWAGSDIGWVDDNGEGYWKSFLEGFQWKFGGILDICLENSSTSLNENVLTDVEDKFSSRLIGTGDFYFLNFNVKSTGVINPNIYFVLRNGTDHPINQSTEYLYLDVSRNQGNIEHIVEGDILSLHTSTQRELVKVIAVDDINGILRVSRALEGYLPLDWYTVTNYAITPYDYLEVINISNLSNQSSIVKGGYGVKLAIDKVKELTDATKVILVAHSMGGLDCREYIQSGYYQDDVVKLFTISTPHQGSNASNLDIEPLLKNLGFDLKSDAVRDLRFSTRLEGLGTTPSSNDDAPYLFGNSVPENSIDWSGISVLTFYRGDINCDGMINSFPIVGLNKKLWPEQVLMHCAVSQDLSLPIPSDDVVSTLRQVPPTDIFNNPFFADKTNIEMSLYEANFIYDEPFVHNAARKAIDQCMPGLDEPNNRAYAYEVICNELNASTPVVYNGFTTLGPGGSDMDLDYFKFTTSENGVVKVNIYSINNQNFWQLSILDISGNQVAGVTNNTSSTATVEFNVASGQTYYVSFTSQALSDSWRIPYDIYVRYTSILNPPVLTSGSNIPSNPVSGSPVNFTVLYTDPSNNAPNSILCFVDGTSHSMTKADAGDVDYTNGVTYTYSQTFASSGSHNYYFTATDSRGTAVTPFPESGTLSFFVTQSASGWNAAVDPMNTNYSPSYVSLGTYLTVNTQVRNTGSYTYTNVPVRVELRNSQGTLAAYCETNTGAIASGSSVIVNCGFTVPSNGINGTYNVTSIILPSLDSNPSDNSYTNSFYIGEDLGNEVFRCVNGLELPLNHTDWYVNGVKFYIYGMNNTPPKYVTLREPSGDLEKVYEGRLEVFGAYDRLVACDIVDSDGWAALYGAYAIANGPTFDNSELNGAPGTTVYAYANVAPGSGNLFESHSSNYEIYSSSNTTIKTWLGTVSRDGSTYSRIKIAFNIPAGTPTGKNTFYFRAEYSNVSNLYDFMRLTINVANPVPAITALSKTSVSADDVITVTGTNLGTSGTVRFGDITASTSAWTATSITCTVPQGIINGVVTVTNTSGTSNGLSYTVVSSTGNPVVSYQIPDQTMNPGETRQIADLNNVFQDPNGGALTFSATSGNPDLTVDQTELLNGRLAVTAGVNMLTESLVTVTATDVTTKTASDAFLVFVPDILEVTPDLSYVEDGPGSTGFTVRSNVEWTPGESADWLTAVKVNSTTLTVTYDDNPSVHERSATITVSGPGVTPRAVIVYQSGKAPVLTVSPSTVQAESPAGQAVVAVTSNTDWSASEGADWLSVAKTSSTALTIMYTENTGPEPRSAEITVSGEGLVSQIVTVNQAGRTTSVPVLTTADVYWITQTSAISGGIITDDGGSSILMKGVCWSTSPDPTVDLLTKTTDGGGSGEFGSEFLGLSAGTTYYLRAYATNSSGTGYGNEIIFKTYNADAIEDIDGNFYNIVTIGTQVWMAENLRTIRFNDGTIIPLITDNLTWASQYHAPAYCWYDNNSSLKDEYGAMYNFYTADASVNGGRNMCPVGWHVPDVSEWTVLTDYLGGAGVAGGRLKETGTEHWMSPNTGAADDYGFTSLPGGYRGIDGIFRSLGSYGVWWSSDKLNDQEASNRSMSYNSASVSQLMRDQQVGFSVRCIKDSYVQQTIPLVLTEGWNILSLAVTPEDLSMRTIFDPLLNAGELVKVQDKTGRALERLSASGSWINEIGLMNPTEGYKVRVNENTALQITGQPVTLPLDIPLESGWNIIGYPSMNPQSASSAFGALISSGGLIKVQNELGQSIEQVEGTWNYGFTNLVPGEGYKVKTNFGATLTITAGAKGVILAEEKVKRETEHFRPGYVGNGLDHMNIYIGMGEEENGRMGEWDEIAVFDGDICVGAAVIEGSEGKYITVAASFDDPVTAEKDGFEEGNRLEIKIWSRSDGSEVILTEIKPANGYGMLFECQGTTVLKAKIPGEAVSWLGDAYPNPSKDRTTFTFGLAGESRVRLEIIDVMGNTIAIVVDETMPGGIHKVEWDNTTANGNKAKKGVYFYRFSCNRWKRIKQLILL